MRPHLRFLTGELCDRIIAEARDVLCGVGLSFDDGVARNLLLDNGARMDHAGERVLLTADLIDTALSCAPSAFTLFDADGRQTHDLGGDRVHFTPGSSAVFILDAATGRARDPLTRDYERYARIVAQLPGIAAQSLSLIHI